MNKDACSLISRLGKKDLSRLNEEEGVIGNAFEISWTVFHNSNSIFPDWKR